MNIGYDAKRVTHNATGLGNYSRFLVRVLADVYPENSYHLYSPSLGKELLYNDIKGLPNVRFHYPQNAFYRKFSSLWRSGGLTKELVNEKIQLYHGLSNEIPSGLNKNNIRSVVTIHDLIFLRYPQFYNRIDRKIYASKYKRACMEADSIIAISETTKRDIVSFYGIDEKKISVVYQGCSDSFCCPITDEKLEEVKTKYHLPERFLLSIGSIERRKNLIEIVKALPLLKDRNISLVAIGKRTSYADEVEKYVIEHNLSDRVQILNNVLSADLPAIYRLSSLFVYPSLFEGFGIPIIEAIHCNVPVIAASGSCLEEAGGKGSIYVDPNNEAELAEQIDNVLSSPALADRMRREGLEFVARFDNHSIAGQIMEIYQRILG